MTDKRNEWTMEQHAAEHRDDLDRVTRIYRNIANRDDWSKSAEELREALEQRNYGAGVSFVVDVTMYGGGPAGGIEFTCDRGTYGLEPMSARVWHQDWFQPKGYADLDTETMDTLWEVWGLEYLLEG